jgi:hypothetical protein
MGDAGREPDSGPQIELKQVSVQRTGEIGYWSIAWNLENKGPRRLRILAVKLPHGQFKSEEKRFEPAIDLKPGLATLFDTLVRCHEPPGEVTENAFVIFYVTWSDESWRVFVRIRVIVDPKGKPQAMTELITTQKAGFSQMPL